MIPSIVHFCFGMTPDFGGRPFSLVHYLSVRSAWEVLKPDVMFMHCAHEPTGEWWELAKPMLQVHRVNPVSGIYGFPAAHPAHRADIIRLAALIAMGGIYLDTDVLVVRSFDDLRNEEFVAAREVTADGIHVGLSNAILLSSPESKFATLCLDGHNPEHSLWQGFRSKGRDENYVEFSVRYPCLLADLCPSLLNALPSRSFLWATWDDAGLKGLFEEDRPVPDDVLAIHLWESHAWAKHLSKLTPAEIVSRDSTFNRLARPFLPGTPSRSLESRPWSDADGLERMDAICRAADFVRSECQPPQGFREKAGRLLRQAARKLRDEMTLPLRCELEVLKHEQEAARISVGPPPIKGEVRPPGSPIPRFGPLDGSLECLKSQLDGSGLESIRFAMFSGKFAEPGVCGWLATQPNFTGFWATASLQRAKELAEWSLEAGSTLRAVMAPPVNGTMGRLIAELQPAPDVLMLADPADALDRWRDWRGVYPRWLMVCGAREVETSQEWKELFESRGYVAASRSDDGTFVIYTTGMQSSHRNGFQQHRRTTTLYGQKIHVPVEVVDG